MSARTRQFLVFEFGSDSTFEGQVVGALERIESGDAMRVVDGLFVARERASGELRAISLSDSPPSLMTSRLLGFRLDDRDRRSATRRAIDGAAGDAVQSLAALLPPGRAVAAVLVEHRAAVAEAAAVPEALAEAVARVGGTEVVSELVEASGMTQLTARLVAAAQHGR